MEYLCLWVMCKGVRPLDKKTEAINNMMSPTNQKWFFKFIDLVDYYCGIWLILLYMLLPLTRLTPSKVTFKWTGFNRSHLTRLSGLWPAIIYYFIHILLMGLIYTQMLDI